jgi:6-pyruvoyl-tetrahydropterin synthase
VAGAPDPRTGFAVDLEAVDHAVTASILDHVDHHQLEHAPPLAGVITTGEGLARAFWQALAPALPAGRLRRVAVEETAKNRFEYRGDV